MKNHNLCLSLVCQKKNEPHKLDIKELKTHKKERERKNMKRRGRERERKMS